jgi:hypothetical protein
MRAPHLPTAREKILLYIFFFSPPRRIGIFIFTSHMDCLHHNADYPPIEAMTMLNGLFTFFFFSENGVSV